MLGNYFRNKCDLIIFSFHNCRDSFIKKGRRILEKLYPKKKLVIFEYSKTTYLESIRRTIQYLKEKGVIYILQIQDDHRAVLDHVPGRPSLQRQQRRQRQATDRRNPNPQNLV